MPMRFCGWKVTHWMSNKNTLFLSIHHMHLAVVYKPQPQAATGSAKKHNVLKEKSIVLILFHII